MVSDSDRTKWNHLLLAIRERHHPTFELLAHAEVEDVTEHSVVVSFDDYRIERRMLDNKKRMLIIDSGLRHFFGKDLSLRIDPPKDGSNA